MPRNATIANQPHAERRRSVVGGTRMALAVAVATLGCGGPTPAEDPTSPAIEAATDDATSPAPPATTPPPKPAPTAVEPRPEDDGRMLWAPPSETRTPIAAERLPAAAELVLLTKPAELAASNAGSRLLESLAAALGATAPDAGLERHAIGVASGDSYGTVRVETLADATNDDGVLLAPAAEELIATSSDASHAVLLVSLPWISGEGGGLFEGRWAPLGDTLRREIDQEWRGAMLSVELLDEGQTAYWELRLVGGRGIPETRRARQLARLASAWREELVRLASDTAFTDHARGLLTALPPMIDALARNARIGADDGQTIANGYLPAAALHNFVLAGQLLVAEQSGAPSAVAAAAADTLTLTDRLAKPVTIRFGRESLEAAVAIVGEAIGAPITINGRDLQLQGITRNQMVGLDVSDTPAGDTLVELLLQANPDTEATGPADERQQLVFVLDESAGEVVITTRTAAERRGEELPAAFQP